MFKCIHQLMIYRYKSSTQHLGSSYSKSVLLIADSLPMPTTIGEALNHNIENDHCNKMKVLGIKSDFSYLVIHNTENISSTNSES